MNILITGASRGIGYETAKLFAADGNNIVYALSRNESGLNRLRSDCLDKNKKTKLIPIVFDLKKIFTQDLSFLKEISRYTDQIDILINNAGFLANKPFNEIDIKTAQCVFDINFFAPAELIKILLPYLQKSRAAHVVNISSMGGFQGSAKFSGLSYYSASKAAISCLTECLAEEYKNSNICFNCLALGAVQTGMLSEAFPGYKAPLTSEQMAEFIYDFAMNGNKFFNGKALPVSVSTP